MNNFVEKIALSKIDVPLLKMINHIEKNDLIIFGDFGLQPLYNNSQLAFLQILEDCYERKAVIIASQLPIIKWYVYIGESTFADAIHRPGDKYLCFYSKYLSLMNKYLLFLR